jgi:pyruvate formate lyase activating enzyme
VVVPGITDSEVRVKEVISIAEKYGNLEKIELLPFRKICLPKYENMGIEFPLNDTPECSAEVVESLKKLIKDQYR